MLIFVFFASSSKVPLVAYKVSLFRQKCKLSRQNYYWKVCNTPPCSAGLFNAKPLSKIELLRHLLSRFIQAPPTLPVQQSKQITPVLLKSTSYHFPVWWPPSFCVRRTILMASVPPHWLSEAEIQPRAADGTRLGWNQLRDNRSEAGNKASAVLSTSDNSGRPVVYQFSASYLLSLQSSSIHPSIHYFFLPYQSRVVEAAGSGMYFRSLSLL